MNNTTNTTDQLNGLQRRIDGINQMLRSCSTSTKKGRTQFEFLTGLRQEALTEIAALRA
jgi:hypothetical protein